MIDFSITPKTIKAKRAMSKTAAFMRSITRYYDDHEHEELTPEEKATVRQLNDNATKMLDEPVQGDGQYLSTIILGEERSTGDSRIVQNVLPTGLGNTAIRAVATPEQKARFNGLFCFMAITEPGFGSE